uniref:Uncharacterized protein n=1 Tax=Parascaris equorum TaxID=6256 RepID=A0A914S0D2_PAREQ
MFDFGQFTLTYLNENKNNNNEFPVKYHSKFESITTKDGNETSSVFCLSQ